MHPTSLFQGTFKQFWKTAKSILFKDHLLAQNTDIFINKKYSLDDYDNDDFSISN